MTLLQSSYRECSLSVIQRGWLSLDWLCYFPSEITHEKVLELALVWLKKNEDTTLCSDPVIHLPSPIPVEILMSVFGQGGRSFWIFRLLPSPKWQTAVQGVQGSWYPGVIPVFLGLPGSHPCLPGTSPYTAPAASCFLSMSYRLRFSGLERLLPSPMFVLALALSSSHL